MNHHGVLMSCSDRKSLFSPKGWDNLAQGNAPVL